MDVVVVSDLYKSFDWDRLNRLFGFLRGGAQGAGLKAVQVETGKFTPADLDHPTVRPDLRIQSLAELPERIGELG